MRQSSKIDFGKYLSKLDQRTLLIEHSMQPPTHYLPRHALVLHDCMPFPQHYTRCERDCMMSPLLERLLVHNRKHFAYSYQLMKLLDTP